jgi:hypothetical protein
LQLVRDLSAGRRSSYYNNRQGTPRKPKKVEKCKKFKENPNKFFSKPLETIELKCLEDEEVSPFNSGEEDNSRGFKSTGKKSKHGAFNHMIGSLRIDSEDRLYTLESESKKVLETNESNLYSPISPAKKSHLSF